MNGLSTHKTEGEKYKYRVDCIKRIDVLTMCWSKWYSLDDNSKELD